MVRYNLVNICSQYNLDDYIYCGPIFDRGHIKLLLLTYLGHNLHGRYVIVLLSPLFLVLLLLVFILKP